MTEEQIYDASREQLLEEVLRLRTAWKMGYWYVPILTMEKIEKALGPLGIEMEARHDLH